MPSFLSRLRTRAASTSTSTPVQSPSSSSVPALAPPIVISPTTPTTPHTPSPPVETPLNRRIHPDVNSLLATYAAEQESSVAIGLRPSSRRHSIDGSSPRLTQIRRALETPATLDEVSEPSHSGEPSQGQAVDDPGQARRLIHRISQLASPGEWSTFGRIRGYTSPKIGDFGDPSASPRPSRPPTAGRSTPSARTTTSRRSSAKPSSSQSHESKHSSNQNPTTPVRSSPKTQITAAVAADLGFDSPRTLGYPSPDIRGLGSHSNSPPPPLPPFNHPSLRIRSGLDPDPTAAISTVKYDPYASEQRTYPRRSRSSREQQPAFSSFPFSKARSRSKSSPASQIPKAQQIFSAFHPHASPSTGHDHDMTTNVPSRTRIRTMSGRRTSADWSAQQATENKNSWPAQVSREMLQLSLGQTIDLEGITFSSAISEDNGEPRDDNVLLCNTNQNLVPFSSSRHPLSHQPPLGSPFSFQGPGINLSDAALRTSLENTSMPDNDSHGKTVDAKGKDPNKIAPSPPIISSSDGGDHSPTQLSDSSLSAGSSPRRSVSEPKRGSFSLRRASLGTAARAISESKGKRKAEEEVPSDSKKDVQRATFAIPAGPRQNRTSGSSSHAPSSYHRKRARLSTSTPLTTPPVSRPGSSQEHEGQRASGSWPSRRPPSRATSGRSADKDRNLHPRGSMSQTSIPISALVSPHAPSIARSTTFHMRDPRKPKKVQSTGWALHLPSAGEPGTGSPVHAWCFFLGFVFFPVWWVASFLRTPKTREVGGTDVEKAVTLDDPQVEFDAKSWRFRCRIMSVFSFLTYVPFIVLLAVLIKRR